MYPKGKPYPRRSYDENGLKICSDCRQHKSKESYHKNIKTYDGITNICKSCNNKRKIKYNEKNKENLNEARRKRYQKNKQKEILYDAEYKKKRRQSDPTFKLLRNTRDRHNKAIKIAGFGKKFRTTLLLGCDAEYLKKYIEIQFKEDMNWSNYGILWNIDHIYPLSKVDWNCKFETSKYCHYSNLQPLYKLDNIKKGNRV
jgi:hypothetical protein